MKELKSKYMKIIKCKYEKDCYIILNTKERGQIGFIEKRRVGRFMHWQLIFNKELFRDCDEIGYTNGCLKEISKFITNLYGEK